MKKKHEKVKCAACGPLAWANKDCSYNMCKKCCEHHTSDASVARHPCKITAFLALSAVFLASPVLGHESFLDDEPESTNLRSQQQEQRELLFWKDQSYYEDIYYRCCNTCEDGENVAGSQSKNNPDWRHPDASAKGYGEGEICKCPKRGSTGKFWSSRSYFEKWQDACTGPNGSLYKKAGSPDAGTCPE